MRVFRTRSPLGARCPALGVDPVPGPAPAGALPSCLIALLPGRMAELSNDPK